MEALTAKAAAEFGDFGAIILSENPEIGNPRPAFELYYSFRFTWLYDMLTEAQREMLDPGLAAMAQSGRRHNARAVLEADIYRNEMTPALDRFFDHHDLLLTPQMPLPAFDAGHDFPTAGRYANWLDWSPFTYPFNFSGHPAASVPCGFVDGLPVGLQIVGPRYREDLVLRASRAWEAAHPFIMPRR